MLIMENSEFLPHTSQDTSERKVSKSPAIMHLVNTLSIEARQTE